MDYLKKQFRKDAEKILEHNTLLGYIMLISFPLFYFFNVYFVQPSPYESFILRFIISLLGLMLILWEKLPNFLRQNSSCVLSSILGFSFPFYFSLMYFKNNGEPIWQVNELVALVILTFFTSWFTFFLITVLSILSAAVVYFFTTDNPVFPESMLATFGSYSAPIIYFIIFESQNEKITAKKIKTARSLSAAIAHEMRTPLATIQSAIQGLKKVLPSLVEFYVNNHKEKSSVLRKTQIFNIQKIPETIETTLRHTHIVIDMLLTNLKDVSASQILGPISMKECISDALEEYPLTPEEKDLILWDQDKDFIFHGNKVLMIHILFNLIKNSLHYIHATGKGKIFISMELNKNHSKLYFKDTGKGIPAAILPHIFERFYSQREQGTGLGLAFCKDVMQSWGGAIYCESVEDKFTTFTLTFPLLKYEEHRKTPK